MSNHMLVQRIGKGTLIAAVVLTHAAWADDVKFTAKVGQSQISMNDTVELRFSIEASSTPRMGEPSFQAPDFEVLNSYSQMSMSTQYDSNTNRFVMSTTRSIGKVLRPLKTGNLKITGIQLK